LRRPPDSTGGRFAYEFTVCSWTVSGSPNSAALIAAAAGACMSAPLIVISALDELASVVRCIEMGAEDYLAKPFDPVLLRARIGACLEK
jgi:PleD family two-component response regulator